MDPKLEGLEAENESDRQMSNRKEGRRERRARYLCSRNSQEWQSLRDTRDNMKTQSPRENTHTHMDSERKSSPTCIRASINTYKYQNTGSDVNGRAAVLIVQLVCSELQAWGWGPVSLVTRSAKHSEATTNQTGCEWNGEKKRETKQVDGEGNLNEKEREKPNLCEMIWSCWSQSGGF